MSLWPNRRPLTVILDLTEKCNLKCRMCYFSATDRLQFVPFERTLSNNGMMPVEVFERVAEELFPRAWRVALACAAEPLIHPRFIDMLEIAGRFRVPDLWFPTNLLALTEKKAEAICQAGVATVGVSIDGTHAQTYESIRIGGRFDRLIERLDLFNRVRREQRRGTKLRIIFTWMQSNFDDLRTLPAFAQEHGASEIDVRFVVPTAGVDVSAELLDGEEPARLSEALAETARDAADRGLRMASFPDYEPPESLPTGWLGRTRRELWRWRTGLERLEYVRYRSHEKLAGCCWPSRFYVVRPNGAVSPCIFWDGDPIGFFPETSYAELAEGEPLTRIREGLVTGEPIGTCRSCSQRKDALYYRLRRRRRTPSAPEPVAGQSSAEESLVEIGKQP